MTLIVVRSLTSSSTPGGSSASVDAEGGLRGMVPSSEFAGTDGAGPIPLVRTSRPGTGSSSRFLGPDDEYGCSGTRGSELVEHVVPTLVEHVVPTLVEHVVPQVSPRLSAFCLST